MKHILKHGVYILFLIILFTQLARPVGVLSQGLGVSPSVQEIEVEPNRSYTIDYVIENKTNDDILEADLSIETFEEGSIPGSATVVPFSPEQDYSSWITAPKTLAIPKNQSTKLVYEVTVPENTSPGAYFFALVYTPRQQVEQKTSGNAVILQSRIATLLFVNVSGDTTKQPDIQNINVTPYIIDPLFDTLLINYDIKVNGASFYRPSGNIFVSDDSSDNIKTVATISSERLILPGGTRSFSYCIESYIITNSCEEKLSTSLPWFGKKVLTLRFDYSGATGQPESVKTTQNIYIFPYKLTLATLVLLLIIYLLFKISHIVRKKRTEK